MLKDTYSENDGLSEIVIRRLSVKGMEGTAKITVGSSYISDEMILYKYLYWLYIESSYNHISMNYINDAQTLIEKIKSILLSKEKNDSKLIIYKSNPNKMYAIISLRKVMLNIASGEIHIIDTEYKVCADLPTIYTKQYQTDDNNKPIGMKIEKFTVKYDQEIDWNLSKFDIDKELNRDKWIDNIINKLKG